MDSQQDSRPVPVIADDRESRGSVVEQLRCLDCFDVAVQRLPVGDYRVDDRFLFEGKTLPDLVLSIESGQLFSQVLRLVAAEALRPALILEGTFRDLQGCGMSWEAIQGALVTVSLFLGLPVLRTRSPEETARTFLYAARQGRAVAKGVLPRRGDRPKGKVALQRHLLQGLPGIGPQRAARLLDRFGSVEVVLSASQEELARIDGIGTGPPGAYAGRSVSPWSITGRADGLFRLELRPAETPARAEATANRRSRARSTWYS